METNIISTEIIAELHTDLIRWKLKKQTYDNKPPFYCMNYDKWDFCPVETASHDIGEIIEYMEEAVNWRWIDPYLTDEGKEKIRQLIKDWQQFLSKLREIRDGNKD